jgi:hypothetical protein
MMRQVPIPPALLSMVLLYGCAGAARHASPARAAEPDCSFRSASTCWTLAGRFPPRHPEPGYPEPLKVLERPPSVLASGADSTAGPR